MLAVESKLPTSGKACRKISDGRLMKLSGATDNAERMLCTDFDISHSLRQAEICAIK